MEAECQVGRTFKEPFFLSKPVSRRVPESISQGGVSEKGTRWAGEMFAVQGVAALGQVAGAAGLEGQTASSQGYP